MNLYILKRLPFSLTHHARIGDGKIHISSRISCSADDVERARSLYASHYKVHKISVRVALKDVKFMFLEIQKNVERLYAH